jgi:glycerol-3-phosphate dehydrogenase
MSESVLRADVLIFGGGVAGLWLLDALRRAGYAALLVEKTALGTGQTVGSQGIIHGGLKYMFDGNLTAPAKAISEMPGLWRDCLSGAREPSLAGVPIRSQHCYIWGTGSIASRVLVKGAGLALKAAPTTVEDADRPVALREASGSVLRVPEPVLDTVQMVQAFACRNADSLMHATSAAFQPSPDGSIHSVRLTAPDGRQTTVQCSHLVFAAGEGNAALRDKANLPSNAMQRRPLHMAMLRGPLPELFGHCIAYPKPRITVTASKDAQGRTVWQLGGQIAEDGVKMDFDAYLAHTREEVAACLPHVPLAGVEFSSYRIDRAEAANPKGQLPDDVHLVREHNVTTAWPTKLALAPRLAQRVLESLTDLPRSGQVDVRDWPPPPIARAPWDEPQRTWKPL